jgi:hypothetical protein
MLAAAALTAASVLVVSSIPSVRTLRAAEA